MLAAQLTGLVLHRTRWDMAAVSSLRVTMERIIMNKDKAKKEAQKSLKEKRLEKRERRKSQSK
jgi:hypothetical protein